MVQEWNVRTSLSRRSPRDQKVCQSRWEYGEGGYSGIVTLERWKAVDSTNAEMQRE